MSEIFLTFFVFLKKCFKIREFHAIICLAKKGGIFMTKVVVRNGNVDGALRTMKQKNARDGLLKKVRERQEGYKKPGVKRREKKEEGIKNTRKRERERY